MQHILRLPLIFVALVAGAAPATAVPLIAPSAKPSAIVRVGGGGFGGGVGTGVAIGALLGGFAGQPAPYQPGPSPYGPPPYEPPPQYAVPPPQYAPPVDLFFSIGIR